MTILRTIKCNVCNAEKQEAGYNKGFPGWGHVVGFYNDQTGEEIIHLCPSCKDNLLQWIKDQQIDLDKS